MWIESEAVSCKSRNKSANLYWVHWHCGSQCFFISDWLEWWSQITQHFLFIQKWGGRFFPVSSFPALFTAGRVFLWQLSCEMFFFFPHWRAARLYMAEWFVCNVRMASGILVVSQRQPIHDNAIFWHPARTPHAHRRGRTCTFRELDKHNISLSQTTNINMFYFEFNWTNTHIMDSFLKFDFLWTSARLKLCSCGIFLTMADV